jgi:hypothetical protein
VIVAAPPPTIVAAVKAMYPRSPVRIAGICRDGRWALVRFSVRGRQSYVALRRGRRWRAVWLNGNVLRSVPSAQRAAVAADVARLRTRCLAP